MILRMRSELTFKTIITAYGLTEATGTVTMCRPEDDPETISQTSGRAIPDTEVRIVDEENNELPVGEAGEIVCRGYNVMLGYLDNPEATSETVDADGWLHTGDVGVMDERGYVRITDRTKDMFIVGGFNAYPAEIENSLMRFEGIAQVAVVGVPDERMGEVGMAFVVAREGVDINLDDLSTWAREQMANFKVPRHFRLVDALPTNASGKVVKVELRERGRIELAGS
jgi:acyl-CoA synthetase (AMP-forming)/AMP-acid ligase II